MITVSTCKTQSHLMRRSSVPAAAHCKQNLRLLSYRNCNWIHRNVVMISLQVAEDNIDSVLSRKTIFVSFLPYISSVFCLIKSKWKEWEAEVYQKILIGSKRKTIVQIIHINIIYWRIGSCNDFLKYWYAEGNNSYHLSCQQLPAVCVVIF